MEMLKARLDKSRTRVLCGMIDCGKTIARVVDRDGERVVWFGPGWVMKRDGSWAFSERAQRRVRRGKTPEARAVSHGIQLEHRAVLGFVPRRLPVLAQCKDPKCPGGPQELDAQPLGVVPSIRARTQVCAAPRCPELTTADAGVCPAHTGKFDPPPFTLLYEPLALVTDNDALPQR